MARTGTWSMPEPNWQPTSSFNSPATPPADAPDAGTLVALPCINQDWLILLLGACDQLRNPSAWPETLTDAQLNTVLEQVNELRSMLSERSSCVNPIVGLSFDCATGLVAHFATGPAETVITNLDFCECSNSCLIPPAPSNPPAAPVNQEACNLAGYLAVNILQVTIQTAQAILNTADQIVTFAHQLADDLTSGNFVIHLLNDAIYDFWGYYVGGVRSDFTAAGSDTALWSAVTCAIYNAIKDQGYVTGANLAAVRSNICAVSYVHADVINALCAFVNHTPLVAWQVLQAVGALDDVDCTNCGTFCHQFDFTVGTEGWSILAGEGGTWVSGQGFVSTVNAGKDELVIALTFPHTLAVTHANVDFCTSGTASLSDERKYVWDSGTEVEFISQAAAPCPAGAHSSTGAISFTASTLWIVLRNHTSGNAITLRSCQISGDGPDPFGVPGCTY